MPRIREYDVAKGIGIFLVIIGHNFSQGYTHQFIYSFHMPLFLIISGALLSHNSNSIEIHITHFFKKNEQLLANYILFSLTYIVFDAIFRVGILHQVQSNFLFWDVYQTGSLFGINVLWFVSSLILAKWVGLRLIRRIKKESVLLLLAILLLAVCAIVAKFTPDLSSLNGIQKLFYFPAVGVFRDLLMAGFYVIGYVLQNFLTIFVINPSSWVFPISAATLLVLNFLLCSFTANVDYHYLILGNSPLTFLLSVTGAIGVLGVSHLLIKLIKISNFLTYWGRNSLFVMETHEYFLLKNAIVYVLALVFGQSYLSSDSIIIVLLLVFVEFILIRIVSPLVDILTIRLQLLLERIMHKREVQHGR